MPADLPEVSSFLSSQGVTTGDCLLAVVPDGYLSPDGYQAAISQGAVVFTGQTVFS